jgi:mannose-6-phosphate isomerase-like protein (cupin superfamily)
MVSSPGYLNALQGCGFPVYQKKHKNISKQSLRRIMKNNYFILTLIVLIAGSILTGCNSNRENKVDDAKDNVKHESIVMKGYKLNIVKSTLENNNFRKVLYTAKHLQLVMMSLKPGEEIGAEIHKNSDQFFRFEGGSGKCIIDGNEYQVKDGDVIIVPAGAKHNVINTGSAKELKMYTIYAQPNHQDGIVRATKKDAETNEEEFDGKTTE